MNTILESMTKYELETYAQRIGILVKDNSSLKKKDLVDLILSHLKQPKTKSRPSSKAISNGSNEKLINKASAVKKSPCKKSIKISNVTKKVPVYETISILGKGKEGVAYKVRNEHTKQLFAMKKFKKGKSLLRMLEEIRLQKIAASANIAPDIVYVNQDEKYFVMEKLDSHLYDHLCKSEGILSTQIQAQIIKLFQKLDSIGVFHADANLMNYMFKGKTLMLIDYGMAKPIDSYLINKLKTKTPNIEYMTVGIILKLKELNCDPSSWSYFLKYVTSEKIESLRLLESNTIIDNSSVNSSVKDIKNVKNVKDTTIDTEFDSIPETVSIVKNHVKTKNIEDDLLQRLRE